MDKIFAELDVVDHNPVPSSCSKVHPIRHHSRTLGLEDVAEDVDATTDQGWPSLRSSMRKMRGWRTMNVRSPLRKWAGRIPLLPEVRVRETSMPPLWHARRDAGAIWTRQPGALYHFYTQSWRKEAPREKAEVEEKDGASLVPVHTENED